MTESSPQISIVMPAFNEQRYIKSAIDSVLRQTFTDFEFIVVDDGSTDQTPQLLSSINDPRLRVATIPHAGLVPALNHGMSLARAPYIARMDADDLSEPDRLRLEREWLNAHAETDIVTGRAILIGSGGEELGMHPTFDTKDMLLELAARNPIVHGSVMMRRRCLPDPVYKNRPEDYELWRDLARAGCKFHCLDQVIYRFRTHDNRYSVREGLAQSGSAVELQWSLLEACTAKRDLNDPNVREKLLIGWGIVAAHCLRTGQSDRAALAKSQFDSLTGTAGDQKLDAAMDLGIESMAWGGLSARELRHYRTRQLIRRPFELRRWKSLLQTIPPVPLLRRMLGRI